MPQREHCTEAVLAERLRRTLKARVRKSVGSIPTDCIIFFGERVFAKKLQNVGVMRESNSRPPAPKAGIIPLDQSPKKLVGSTGT